MSPGKELEDGPKINSSKTDQTNIVKEAKWNISDCENNSETLEAPYDTPKNPDIIQDKMEESDRVRNFNFENIPDDCKNYSGSMCLSNDKIQRENIMKEAFYEKK